MASLNICYLVDLIFVLIFITPQTIEAQYLDLYILKLITTKTQVGCAEIEKYVVIGHILLLYTTAPIIHYKKIISNGSQITLNNFFIPMNWILVLVF